MIKAAVAGLLLVSTAACGGANPVEDQCKRALDGLRGSWDHMDDNYKECVRNVYHARYVATQDALKLYRNLPRK